MSRKAQKITEILDTGDKQEVRALFAFSVSETEEEILLKFNLWGRYFFPNYYKKPDADFHRDIDKYNLATYRGTLKYFVNIVFRGGAKTTRTKLFCAFVIANDTEHFRKYIKILTKDGANAKQFTTDIYNMFVSPRFRFFYPEIFQKTDAKREETMSAFTTHAGVKVRAMTIGVEQRGQLQGDEDSSRPDWIIFDDIETRKTLRSALETHNIWENMEEARTGLDKDGSAVYLANYLSERGNVHKLVSAESPDRKVLIVPIKFNGKPMWSAYTMDEINQIEANTDDFAGEYLCEPSVGHDVYFDRALLDAQVKKTPAKTIADFKIFHAFNPSHRYGSGHDVAGGLGLDSSTSCFIDFTTYPARVVATFKNNTIKPDAFGDEIAREANIYGAPIVAPEKNNHGHATIGRLKQIYENIYFTEQKVVRVGMPPRIREYGWDTNTLTKTTMMTDLKSAVEDGLLELSDPDIIAEMKAYTRDDMLDKEDDPRLATRHFDLLIACAIAWQMRHHAEIKKETANRFVQPDYESPFN